MQGKTISLVYRSYAHQKATRRLASILSERTGCDLLRHGLAEEPDLDALCAKLAASDLVVLSCGGRDISAILSRLHALPRRPATVSLFPGIVVRSQFEAFLTRVRCDHVLLNSAADASAYRRLCGALGLAYNGVLYGASWFDGEVAAQSAVALKADAAGTVFFEQADVPKHYQERRRLAQMLVQLAARNPTHRFYVKTRAENITEGRGNGKAEGSLACLLEEVGYPENLHICNGEVRELLAKTDSCVTVSSSAALEWLLAGRKVFVVSEFASRKYFSDFFAGSRLFHGLERLDPTEPPAASTRWLSRNVRYPDLTADQLLTLLRRQEADRIVRTGPTMWLRLGMHVLPHFICAPRLTMRKLRNAMNLVR